MMRNAQPIRTRLLTAILAGMVSAGLATTALAAGTTAGAKAKAGRAQAASPGYLQAAEAHIDAYGSTNTQGQDDATRGADRAADRAGMNGDERVPSAAAEPAADARSVAQAKRPASR